MNYPGFCQQAGQILHRIAVCPFCAAGRAALKQHRQFLKGQTYAERTYPPAGHADGVSSFQKHLFPVVQFFKCFPNCFGPDAVPENLSIVPVVIPAHILAGFLSVLVLHRLVERDTAAILLCHARNFAAVFSEQLEDEDLDLYMNQGSTYENNVEPRDDTKVIKCGLHIPKHAESYDEFVNQLKVLKIYSY